MITVTGSYWFNLTHHTGAVFCIYLFIITLIISQWPGTDLSDYLSNLSLKFLRLPGMQDDDIMYKWLKITYLQGNWGQLLCFFFSFLPLNLKRVGLHHTYIYISNLEWSAHYPYHNIYDSIAKFFFAIFIKMSTVTTASMGRWITSNHLSKLVILCWECILSLKLSLKKNKYKLGSSKNCIYTHFNKKQNISTTFVYFQINK